MDNLVGAYIDDRFQVVERIGEGAMGVVYRAFAIEWDMDVAIKVMRRTTPDPAAPERFLREAQALATVKSEQIVKAFAFDRDMSHGLLYVAMEFVDGNDLSDVIGYGRLPEALVLDVIEQVAIGLKEAHAHSILHRDLKPGNLKLVGLDERIQTKIFDFGLVHVKTDRSRLTDEGKAPGTLSYMSPDELQELELDERIDIYALGVMAYEMLSGLTPFRGPVPLEIAKAILTANPQSLLDFDVPIVMKRLVEDMMARDRADRISSAVELLARVTETRFDLGLERFAAAHSGRSDAVRRDFCLRPRL